MSFLTLEVGSISCAFKASRVPQILSACTAPHCVGMQSELKFQGSTNHVLHCTATHAMQHMYTVDALWFYFKFLLLSSLKTRHPQFHMKQTALKTQVFVFFPPSSTHWAKQRNRSVCLSVCLRTVPFSGFSTHT